jgi:hypothetical protein
VSIVVKVLGATVTPMEAAAALNVADGPYVLVCTERENGPEAHVYPRRGAGKGALRPPWLSYPTFTAGTVEQIREAAHVIGAAADLIIHAGILSADNQMAPPPAC